MTDYAKMTDPAINAAVAERVMGWFCVAAWAEGFRWSNLQSQERDNWFPATDMNHWQEAWRKAGEAVRMRACEELVLLAADHDLYDSKSVVYYILTHPGPRTLSIALLKADAEDQQ